MLIKKEVGRIPIDRGDYQKDEMYYRLNDVRLYNCVFRSKKDKNINPPATLDEETHKIIFNTEDWIVLLDGSEAFLSTHFNNQ